MQHCIAQHRIAYRSAVTSKGPYIVRMGRRKEEVLDLLDGQPPVHIEVDGMDDQVHLRSHGMAWPARDGSTIRYVEGRTGERHLFLELEEGERLQDAAEGFRLEVQADVWRREHALSLRAT